MNIETKSPDPLELSLTEAVICSSNSALLLLDGQLSIVAASLSFCSSFEIDHNGIVGMPFSKLGQGEWDTPQLISLLEATVSQAAQVQAYEFLLNRAGHQPRILVVYAKRLAYADKSQTRLLLSIEDVSEARQNDKIKEDLLREKAILLSEIQHRVANSLQIIASILLQSARKVQSDETRGHLKDAHSRLMSIAAVQRQLATSSSEKVDVREYFIQLCRSLSASMIEDAQILTIEVVADEGVTTAKSSVSLGLIVTELVINALKHAFPEHRPGKIIVSYKVDGANWTLSVRDNGVGMPTGPHAPKAGLGTNIVEALASSLFAEVSAENLDPGTAISVTHTKAASPQADRRPM